MTIIDPSQVPSRTGSNYPDRFKSVVAVPAGEEDGHCLYNHTEAIASYLEIGDRTPEDQAHYPDDDLIAKASQQGWQFTHKDGKPY